MKISAKTIENMANETTISYLQDIMEIQANMVYKTKYEKETSKKEIKQIAKELQDLINNDFYATVK